MRAFGGTLAALALLTVGFLFLPAPGGTSAGGIFAALWLLVTGFSVVAFGRELWMLLQLSRIRSRWRRAAKRPRQARSTSRVTLLRERERRLD